VTGKGIGPTGANQKSLGVLRVSPKTEEPNQGASQGANQGANPGANQLIAPGRGPNLHPMTIKSRTENTMGTETARLSAPIPKIKLPSRDPEASRRASPAPNQDQNPGQSQDPSRDRRPKADQEPVQGQDQVPRVNK